MKKELTKKLSLNKKTVSNLNMSKEDLKSVHGGTNLTIEVGCVSELMSCFEDVCGHWSDGLQGCLYR